MTTEFEQTEAYKITFKSVASSFLDWFDAKADQLAYGLYQTETGLFSTVNPSILLHGSIVLTATLTVVLGAYATIVKPLNAKTPNKHHPYFDPSDNYRPPAYRDEDWEDDEDNPFVLTGWRIVSAPIMGSGALLALYYALKNFDISQLVYYLLNFTAFISFMANYETGHFLLRFFNRQVSHYFKLSESGYYLFNYYKLTLSKDRSLGAVSGVEPHFFKDDSTKRQRVLKEFKLEECRKDVVKEDQLINYFFSTADLIATFYAVMSTALFVVAINYGSKVNWIISNTTAFSFSIFGISSIRIATFRSALLMLGLFFLYDIYFVFGTNVMTTVAKSIDVPIKLVFPADAAGGKVSMIGTGDLVLPGVFISLCLKYDIWKFHELNPDTEFHHLLPYPRPYFFSSIIGYVVGLSTTCFVSEHYKAGQPALFYIVPSLSISLLLTCVWYRDLTLLFKFDDVVKGEVDNYDSLDDDDFGPHIRFEVSPELLQVLGEDIDSDDNEDDPDYNFPDIDDDTAVIMDEYLEQDMDSEIEEIEGSSVTIQDFIGRSYNDFFENMSSNDEDEDQEYDSHNEAVASDGDEDDDEDDDGEEEEDADGE